MYRDKDTETGNLFSELLPYGGKLDKKNQWMKLSGLIPWEKIKTIYAKYYAATGRPAKDSRLITGLLIVKHRKSYSDRDLIEQFHENPYVQYFCGYDQFVSKGEIHYSTLSRQRKRLGKEYFKQFEQELIGVLVKQKILKPQGIMLDATVSPADIAYPTDLKIMNTVRAWLCKKINWIRTNCGIKEKIRTYSRTAKKLYLNLQKKKRKRKKAVITAKKQMLQYLRRNLKQFEALFLKVSEQIKTKIRDEFKNRLETAQKIYQQQREMFKKKTTRVNDRIVSFHWPEVRPIVRGKAGKDVEFGPKVHLSLVDGYTFLDKISYDAYNESQELKNSLKDYRNRFNKLPDAVTADRLYGTRWNRKFLKRIKIKDNFNPLGRAKQDDSRRKEIKVAQRKRNRIEGVIGVGKRKYELDRIKYRIPAGEDIWVRMGLVGMNLTAALSRM